MKIFQVNIWLNSLFLTLVLNGTQFGVDKNLSAAPRSIKSSGKSQFIVIAPMHSKLATFKELQDSIFPRSSP